MEYSMCEYITLLFNLLCFWWASERFPVWDCAELSCWEHYCTCLLVNICLRFCRVTYAVVKLLAYGMCVCSAFLGNSRRFYVAAESSYTDSHSHCSIWKWHPCQHLVFSLFHFNCLCGTLPHCGFHLRLPENSECSAPFICLLILWVSSLWSACSNLLSWVVWRTDFYVSWLLIFIHPSYQSFVRNMCYLSISSYFVSCLFYSFMLSVFWWEVLNIVDWPVFCSMVRAFHILFKKSLFASRSWRCSPLLSFGGFIVLPFIFRLVI